MLGSVFNQPLQASGLKSFAVMCLCRSLMSRYRAESVWLTNTQCAINTTASRGIDCAASSSLVVVALTSFNGSVWIAS